MNTLLEQSQAAQWSASFAYLAIAATAVSCAALAALHFLSPEYAMSWRMVSEYANGQYRGVLTLMFASWAASYFALMLAAWPIFETALGKTGLAFLLLASVGAAMGALFDINHPLHGPAAMIGIPSMAISAILVTIAFGRRADIAAPPFWTAHITWIGFALMIASFMLFFSALKQAGVDVSAQTEPLKELPEGVSGYVGYANRLIFAGTYLWCVLAALAIVRAAGRS
jgi:Protein of unknown function (DUF998)